jgi:hypothetical protein
MSHGFIMKPTVHEVIYKLFTLVHQPAIYFFVIQYGRLVTDLCAITLTLDNYNTVIPNLGVLVPPGVQTRTLRGM